jgi:hypothetical protein
MEGHMAGVGEMRNVYSILVENLKGKQFSAFVVVNGRIILKCILNKI